MALGHADVGTALSRTEWQSSGTGAHVIDGQQAGDLIYASTTSALARLEVGGTAGMMLTSNGSIPVWSTSIYVTDNESTAENNLLTFVADAGTSTGAHAIEMDGNLHYNPSTGTLTAPVFAGALTGAVTGTASLASTVTVIDSSDASSYIAMFDSATGSLAAKTDAGLTYDASSGMLTATGFTGPLTGVASTATALASARTIGGTSFDGTANIAVALSATATALASARTINGVSFDGTGNITVTAAGSTLSDTVPVSKGGTGATSLADKAVLISQDTGTATVGAVALTTSGQIIIGGSSGPAAATLTEGSNITITNGDGSISIAADAAGTPTAITVADSSNTTASVAFFESATGDLGPKTDSQLTYNANTGILTATGFAGPITGNVTGNASGSSGSTTGNAATATALETARTIGGVSFDGTANIAVTLAATATALASARTINGVSFDGTGNITVTAAGSTLSDTVPISKGGTGATSLDNLITLATHTTGDYVQNITAGTGLTSTGATSGENIAHSLSVDASQTQITAVGTIATGVWQGTAVAQAYIADNSISLAKMAGGTDGNIISYDASGDPVAIATGDDGQVLTSAGAGQPPAFEDAGGGGGLVEYDVWSLSSNATNPSAGTLNTNLIRWNPQINSVSVFEKIGTGMSKDESGNFSFPSTGKWEITLFGATSTAGSEATSTFQVHIINDSVEGTVLPLYTYGPYAISGEQSMMLDITDISTQTVHMYQSLDASITLYGDDKVLYTGMKFKKVGDT